MNKKIVITVQDGNVVIRCMDKSVVVTSDNFEISGYDVYELLGYKRGDQYETKIEGIESEHALFKVLEELKRLFDDLTSLIQKRVSEETTPEFLVDANES